MTLPAAMRQRWDNLPAPLTSFVGREREVAELARLLEEHRLVTLAGAPGVGKTRLALRVAAEVRSRFGDGVWLVELATLAEPALVTSVVAAALGLRDQGGRMLADALVDRLRSQHLLLTLDSCDHLLDVTAALVHALLRACPRLQVLATSREPLGVIGEVTWRVPSLTLPAIDERASRESLGALLRSEAARLFVERAAAARPGFVATESNAPAVAQICARLDGIPLAIELAAARVRALAPTQIAARLDDRFALLTGGIRPSLPRHRTLRALVDWSHDLLTDGERALLRRLAVFVGGWTLQAAEAVAGEGGKGKGERVGDGSRSPFPFALSPHEVLDLLDGLVDKSLVVAEEQEGEVRYRLLETLREYALERLRESGEEAVIRQRHLEWALALAERAEPELVGPQGAMWGHRLEREHDNLRAAVAWCLAQADAETPLAAVDFTELGLRLGWALWRFWWYHGHLSEGRARVASILAADRSGRPTALRAGVLFGAGILARQQRAFADAQRLLEECIVAAEQAGHQEHLAGALTQLANIALAEGRCAAARSLYQRSVTIRRGLDVPRELGISLLGLARVAHAERDDSAARAGYEEGLGIFRALGAGWEITATLCELGRLAADEGDLSSALSHYREALVLARESGYPAQIAPALEGCALVAAAQGQVHRALTLAAAASVLRDDVLSPLGPTDAARLDRAFESARRDLGRGASDETWAAGRTMAFEEAIEIALREDAPASLATPAPAAPQAVLTRREREIAGLVAAVRTNRQIADELVVSERTVEWHVANILGKLGVQTRAQVAVWAAEHGLQPAD